MDFIEKFKKDLIKMDDAKKIKIINITAIVDLAVVLLLLLLFFKPLIFGGGACVNIYTFQGVILLSIVLVIILKTLKQKILNKNKDIS